MMSDALKVDLTTPGPGRKYVPYRPKKRWRGSDPSADGGDIAWSPEKMVEMYGHVDQKAELVKCYRSVAYFADRYAWIFNATSRGWVKLQLWPAQKEVIEAIDEEQYVIVLKARQLGMSWLTMTYALWLMIFRPAASLLIMSKREDEAIDLLSNRLTGMYRKLPVWMQSESITKGSLLELSLANGSVARAFSTGGGRSYTATMAILDEADFVPNLNEVLNALKPTVDAGGKLVMISTVDKSEPMSTYKQIYRAALREENNYLPIFLPWSARPSRTPTWYNRVKKDMYTQDGSHDSLWQEYPATVEEALAPRQLDKRMAQDWIARCEQILPSLDVEIEGLPAVMGLRVYAHPEKGRKYVIGADPAEGNPRSDDSVAVVMDYESWEEVACWSGRIEPDSFARGLGELSRYYNRAGVLVERNNHGHAVLLAIRKLGHYVRLLEGHDTPKRAPGSVLPPDGNRKYGWLSNVKGKALMYDFTAEALRDGMCVLHTQETALQLASIEAATLSAPEGMHDDFATAFALAVTACAVGRRGGHISEEVPQPDVLELAAVETWKGKPAERRFHWVGEVERWKSWR